MIELITGLPGNGKTLYTIAQVKAAAIRDNRAVFYHGIPELTLNWERLEDPKNWMTVPPGSIVVIDEAQKTFRNRSVGQTPPEFVTALETHRHLGIDLVLITQHPSLIDPSVRRLAGKHQHMVRIWGTEASTVHQWDAVKDNCDKSRTDSNKKKWAFDKSVYGLYKSAEVHTMKRSIPARVKVLLGLFVLLACAIAYMVMFIGKKTGAIEADKPEAALVGTMANPMLARPSSSGESAVFDPVADARQYVAMATPRVDGLPHTAPRYDAITVPVRAPVPAACVQVGSPAQTGDVKCKCYSQQGTPMDVEFNMCIQFARNGYFQDFDAEKDQQSDQKAARGVAVLSSRPDHPVAVSGAEARLVAFADTSDSKMTGARPEPNLNDGPPRTLLPSRTVVAQ